MSQPPEKLYKYMTAATAEKVIDSGSLRWSSPVLFNDPFDLQFDLHVEFRLEALIDRLLKRFVDVYAGRRKPLEGSVLDSNARLLQALIPGLKEKLVQEENRPAISATIRELEQRLPALHEELRAMIGQRKILCLSETANNLLMWAHYAQHHTGAVFQLSCVTEDEYVSAWEAAKPVRYAATMPILADEEALFNAVAGRGNLATPEHFESSVYVKADAWAYKREWRVLGGWENAKQTEDIPFRSSELTGIYLGCRMSEDERRRLLDMIGKRYPNIRVQLASRSSRSFDLEFGNA